MNFRSDRARQITRPFIEPKFEGFARGTTPKLGAFVSLTEYNEQFDNPVAYPPERLHKVFGELLALHGLRQLRLAKSTGKAMHLLGLLSPGGVHSHESHIHGMAELAVSRGLEKIYLHGFLDGRDTPPRSALSSIQAMQDKFQQMKHGRIASIIGRYYAMDRDHRWPRI